MIDFKSVPMEMTRELANHEKRIRYLELRDTGQAMGRDGWFSGTGTWSWVSSDSPVFVMSVPDADAALMNLGCRINLTQGTQKFFVLVAKGASAGGYTSITIYGGTLYTLINAAISAQYFSPVHDPVGFSLDLNSWRVVASDSNNLAQAAPVAGTVYNIGGLSVTVPIGLWNLGFTGDIWDDVVNLQASVSAALSTNAAAISDVFLRDTYVGYGTSVVSNLLKRRKLSVSIAAKTTYYLVETTGTAGVVNLRLRGDIVTTELYAECAYI